MARTIQFDFRKGGGSPTEILFGTIEIYGTKIRPNGTYEVVTSATTLRLVDGQATLTNAQETPTDGSWHYHAIVRDLECRGWSFRKFLPVGASPVLFHTLSDAW